MRKNLIALVSSVSVFTLTACGTVLHAPVSYIDIGLENAESVECKIFNEKYNYHAIVPKRVMVDNSRYPYQVHCSKEGYQDFIGFIEPRVSHAHVMNAGNLGVGVPVDMASNSVFEYPDRFTVRMTPLTPQYQGSFQLQSTIITKDPVIDDARNRTFIQPDLRFEYHVQPYTTIPAQPLQQIPQSQIQRQSAPNPIMTMPQSILEREAEERGNSSHQQQMYYYPLQ